MLKRGLTAMIVSFGLVSGLGVSCKKPAAPEPIVEPPPPPPPPEAPKQIPAPVVQMVQNFQKVYFEFDSASLEAESRAALDANGEIMRANTDIKVEIQGHADERGSTDYNLALGQRRASAVYRYLTTGAGVSSSRLKQISYGEEQPLAGGSTEAAWTKNRRCEFVITWGGSDYLKGSN